MKIINGDMYDNQTLRIITLAVSSLSHCLSAFLSRVISLGYKSRFGIPRSGTGIFLLFLLSFSTQAQINNKLYHSLEATYIGLNAMDLITTYHGLDKGAEELDPLLKPFINNKPEAILIKSLSTIAVLGVLRSIKRDYPKAALITLISLNIGLSYVVYHNYQISLTLRF